MTRRPAWLVACLALLAPQPALGQERTPTPSAEELWRTYPLYPSPEASGSPAPAASKPRARVDRPARTPAARPEEGGGGPPAPLGIIIVVVAAGGALVLVRILRRHRDGPEPESTPPGPSPVARALQYTAPALSSSAAPVMLAAGGPRRPQQRAPSPQMRIVRDDAEARPPAPAALPDTTIAWTAEIRWRQAGAHARFHVAARSETGIEMTLAKAPALEWPPGNPKALQALTDAVNELEGSLLAAGWTQLRPGDAWYAKRFAWEPVAVPERSPVFERAPVWPEGSEELFRCEIKWHPGYARSRFEAVIHRPGARRARAVGSSATFRWELMGDPDPEAPEYREEAERLETALEEAGWEPAGRGKEWYAARYVWRGEGEPPDHLDLVAPADDEGARLSRLEGERRRRRQ